MQAEAFWDGMAQSYAKRPIQNMDQHDRTVERSAAYLTPEAEVLEVGCGTGTIAMRLAPHAGHVLATDISGALLDIARQRQAEQAVDTVSFARHGLFDLPEGQFDMVAAYNLLHLIEDFDGAVASLAARVKPGGVLVTKTGALAENWRGWPLRLVIGAMRMIGKAPYVGFLSSRDIDAAMARHGLEIVESETMGKGVVTRFLVARKV
ncbi:class I SAM-dependent methyltransferase [Pseudooceanicola onchidii]|uniref:class I SAM-dependent methyltransferase n=1 Tax=Pseudooceanicola onchidii TaxID=2562279 RepID=UPI00145A4E40|nr:class I SAM-dependent methyltransferase [Pseudooceanicola onchidii]